MLTYYIDEPLSDTEQASVIGQIRSLGSNIIDKLEFKQITEAIPDNQSNLAHTEIVKTFENILITLGAPAGAQSVFILPKGGLSWGMLLQIAFKNVSSFYPFVVQPWEMSKDRIYQRRQNVLVTDINTAFSG